MLQEFVPGGLPFLDAVILRNSPSVPCCRKRRVLGNPFLSQSTSIYFSALCSIFFPVNFLRLSWNNPDSMVFQPHSGSSSDRRSLGHKIWISRKMPSWLAQFNSGWTTTIAFSRLSPELFFFIGLFLTARPGITECLAWEWISCVVGELSVLTLTVKILVMQSMSVGGARLLITAWASTCFLLGRAIWWTRCLLSWLRLLASLWALCVRMEPAWIIGRTWESVQVASITMASIIPYLRMCVSYPANNDLLSPGYNLGDTVRSLCLSCHPCGFCPLSRYQVWATGFWVGGDKFVVITKRSYSSSWGQSHFNGSKLAKR